MSLPPLKSRSARLQKLWEPSGDPGLRPRADRGTTHQIEEIPKIDHRRAHDIEVIIDRLKVDQKVRSRIGDSIEAALDLGKGVVHIIHLDEGPKNAGGATASVSTIPARTAANQP